MKIRALITLHTKAGTVPPGEIVDLPDGKDLIQRGFAEHPNAMITKEPAPVVEVSADPPVIGDGEPQ